MTDFLTLPSHGEDGVLRVVVETPRGSQVKLKYEPSLQAFALSRPLVLGLHYPHDWGFVPSTRAEDGDPLDAMVLFDAATFPGVVIPCRPIGVIELSQRSRKTGKRERNDRVLTVPAIRRRGIALDHVDAIAKEERQELEAFFMSAVLFEGKEARVLGWRGPSAAEKLIRKAKRAFG